MTDLGMFNLVTGADAPIGERLIRELLDDSRVGRVLGVSNLDPDTLPFRPDDRLALYRVDLTRERQTHELLFGPARRAGVRVVVHTAMHRSAWAEGRQVHRLNVEATDRDLLAARTAKLRDLIGGELAE